MHNQKNLIILSPFIIICLGFLAAKLSTRYIGEWAFIPTALIYWTEIIILILITVKSNLRKFFQKPIDKKKWLIMCIVIGLIPSIVLVTEYHRFNSILLIVLWIVFAVMNSFLEEIYWRGLLLDYTDHWHKTLSIGYSTVLFVLSHPFIWGVFSIANRSWSLILSSTIVGVVWSLTSIQTRSLRWSVFSHFLVDIFNISVLGLLNIYIPSI